MEKIGKKLWKKVFWANSGLTSLFQSGQNPQALTLPSCSGRTRKHRSSYFRSEPKDRHGSGNISKHHMEQLNTENRLNYQYLVCDDFLTSPLCAYILTKPPTTNHRKTARSVSDQHKPERIRAAQLTCRNAERMPGRNENPRRCLTF